MKAKELFTLVVNDFSRESNYETRGTVSVDVINQILDYLDRPRIFVLQSPGLPTEQQIAEAKHAVIDLVRQGQIIRAIKLWREITGMGLKDAKDAVDAMRDKV